MITKSRLYFITTLLTALILSVLPVQLNARAETCQGDFDKNGEVGASDFTIFAENFGQSGCRVNCAGDFDYDTDVDGANLTTMIQNLGKSGCINLPPESDPGPDKNVFVGEPVTIDGSGSRDPDGDPLTYQWSFVSTPAGSTAILSNTSGSAASFTADEAGEYRVQLTVSDGAVDSAVQVTVITAAYEAISIRETKISAADPASKDHFGDSVAISGDYAIVGADYDDDNGIDSGSAYIFMRKGAVWVQQAKLLAGDGAADDRFGCSVAINGDFAIVGANGDDDAGNQSGSAYIFKREGTNWIQQTKLTAGDAAQEDHFGASVAIHGDLAVVGADGNDNIFNDNIYKDSGAAYVFRREGANWIQQSKLSACDGAEYDQFGESVALSDDYIVVSAIYDDGQEVFGGPQCDADFEVIGGPEPGYCGFSDWCWDWGSVYIFKREGADWIPKVKLKASDGFTDGLFGRSVGISGDDVIVGACSNVFNKDTGSAYLFKREGESWSEQSKLVASDAALNDSFGTAVAIDGDTAVIGAYENDDHGDRSGSAYIFKRVGENWIEQEKITAGDAAIYGYFGKSVAINGDYAVVGASEYEWFSNDPGAAYIYNIQYSNPVALCEDLITTVRGLGLPPGIEAGLTDDLETAISEIGGGNPQAAIDRLGTFIGKVEAESGQNISSENAAALILQARQIVDAITVAVSIDADRKIVERGEWTTLRWTSRNAAACVIEPIIGGVPPTASVTIAPAKTTTFTITATGPGGPAAAAVTIAVIQPAPTASIDADPDFIKAGKSSTLTWQTTNADSTAIEPGIGSVPASGSVDVFPAETTTYILTANGTGGTSTAQVTVNVRQLIQTRIRYQYDAVGRIKRLTREQLP